MAALPAGVSPLRELSRFGHIRCNTILGIPAYLYPKWIEKVESGQQYSVQTFTSAPKL